MRVKKKESTIIFIALFFLLLCYPVWGGIVGKSVTLSGVVVSENVQKATIENVMKGTYQTSLNTWVENNFPGRNLLIKLRSQFMYTCLNETPNKNVVIGKDKYLFEPVYIYSELGIRRVADEQYFVELIDKLEKLQSVLSEDGKELYIFITPSKAYFCGDKIPEYFYDMEINNENNYELFSKYIAGSSLKYFDAHVFIQNYSGEQLNAPVYYPTGIHWSSSWGMSAAKAFSEYISENSKWQLSESTLTEAKVLSPEWPDTDLYQSLNLIVAPTNIPYYSAELSVIEEHDKPNVFLRGGSFMGQSLNGLVRAGIFSEDVHFENNYYFTDNYSSQKTLSAFDAYDEMDDLPMLLSKSDIIILEVNEANIDNMSWGFVELLLEHPEYLKYPER